jgi:carbamoyl-phosphate synthase large subunit
MINILVSGASGIVGYGILRSLRESKEFNLVATTIYDDSAALLFCDIFEKAPLSSDTHYFEWLIKIIEKHAIDYLIPGIESDMILWNKNRGFLENLGVVLVLNNSDLIELCSDKWAFYSKLIVELPEYAIPTFLSIEDIHFDSPIILKPRVGFGSKGIIRLNSKIELESHRKSIGSELMIQPIVGNDDFEYTVSGFFDKNSNLIDYLALKRKLSKEGYTEVATVVDIDIEDILIKFGSVFKPFGPTNFQFRFDGLTFKILEINPRISSSTSIRSKFGYNEAQIMINYLKDGKLPNKIDKNLILDMKAIRYTEELVLK